jgi:hypothetical protein
MTLDRLRRHVGCGCQSLTPLARRRFLGLAIAAGLLPRWANAAEGNYEAMLLTCIDPRFTQPPHQFMASREWQGKYSQFTFAGASIGVVADPFADWRKTFWDNLATSIQLHHIKSVVALNHRDCGAARIAYGEARVADATVETETHREALAEFRKQVGQRHANLQVITGLMSLNGNVEMIG